jgi:acetyl/propionyl-CoA carboxylase alpha subunit
VTIHYDPLLAKLVTWGRDRAESIERMADALRRTAVLGVVTNLSRLKAIVDHPSFRRGELHTGFIEEHLGTPSPPPSPPAEALAALAAALHLRAGARPRARGQAPDPWASVGPWRLGER